MVDSAKWPGLSSYLDAHLTQQVHFTKPRNLPVIGLLAKALEPPSKSRVAIHLKRRQEHKGVGAAAKG